MATCPACAENVAAGSTTCPYCGEELRRAAPPRRAASSRMGDDAGMRMLLPVGRSGWAIAAGYLGLFSLICFPAPIAVIVSAIAIWDIKTHPEKHGMGRAIFGMVMGLLGSGFLLFGLAGALMR